MGADMSKSRTHLPVPSAARTGLITYDAKDPDTSYPPIAQLRPPEASPNVLTILLNAVGFGAALVRPAHLVGRVRRRPRSAWRRTV